MPKSISRGSGKKYGRRYPWNVWFAKRVFTVHRGVDYQGHTYAFAQIIRNAAKKCGVTVSIRTAADDRSLTITVSKESDDDGEGQG